MRPFRSTRGRRNWFFQVVRSLKLLTDGVCCLSRSRSTRLGQTNGPLNRLSCKSKVTLKKRLQLKMSMKNGLAQQWMMLAPHAANQGVFYSIKPLHALKAYIDHSFPYCWWVLLVVLSMICQYLTTWKIQLLLEPILAMARIAIRPDHFTTSRWWWRQLHHHRHAARLRSWLSL
jgi:hypothetical protein